MLGADVTVAIMDALGIQAVLFDEFEAAADDGAMHPGYRLADGVFRCVGPNVPRCGIPTGSRS
jgi:L-fuconolactonase